ncbi:MAG: MBL fold metallo-hydrolase [Proteobacteria bacterium]|nr:MBL fold metallo-hydrolase [Pseudomonadota bacterium]
MQKTLEISEALWNGESDTYTHHPFEILDEFIEIKNKFWFYKGFANTIVAETKDGLIIVDPAANFDRKVKFKAIRSVTQARLNTAIYTHGHSDHTYGVPQYLDESREKGWPEPRVIAHHAILNRFQAYRETRMWKGYIDLRQFRGGNGEPFPTDVNFHPPNVTYSERLDIEIGGVQTLIRHTRGETDDHSWVFFPAQRILCTGDLFIWGMPNAGNPQKVQRYALEWAAGLRKMASLDPEVLLPGHGFPIIGAERVRQALNDTATFLEVLNEQTLAMMNKGMALETIISSIQVPEELLGRPYLQPVYDEVEFIVRNIWRLYGGWYDGLPSHLKPATEKAQGLEIAELAGGADKLVERAEKLVSEGGNDNLRMACHLAEWAIAASPDDPAVRRTLKRVYTERAKTEPSTMAMGIFVTRAREMGGDVEEWMKHPMVFLSQKDVWGK